MEEAEAKMEDDFNGVDDVEECQDEEGRRQTPVLQQGKGSVHRHHLDLTTPAVGGALLTCPPSKSSKIIVTSRSGTVFGKFKFLDVYLASLGRLPFNLADMCLGLPR